MNKGRRRAAEGTLVMQADYKYDAFANRIEKSVWTAAAGTVVTRYVMDGWNNNKPVVVGNERWDVKAELDGNNNRLVEYINGDGVNQVLARVDLNGVAWLLTDNLGSVRDVINNAGVVLSHIDYSAYGMITYQSNAAYSGNVLYDSDLLDPETGLFFSRARYLDPFAGRWTTEDPLDFAAGDANLYRFVGNSPTNATDPSGCIAWGLVGMWALVVVAVAGAVVVVGLVVNLVWNAMVGFHAWLFPPRANR